MRQTRKRARRAPSLGWACAHARLEERLLLSGSTSGTDAAAAIVDATAGAASSLGSVPFNAPPIAFMGLTAGGFSGGTSEINSSAPQLIDIGSSSVVGGGSSPVHSSPLDADLGPTIGPTAPLGPQVGFVAPGTPDGPGAAPTLIGDPIGPHADGIEATVLEPMEAYYFSYSPLDGAALGVLPTSGGLGCASMASIVRESSVEIVDLTDPPAVPQPTAARPSPWRAPPGPMAESAETGRAEPAAAPRGEPPPETASPGALTPETTTPAENPPVPIAAGLRLSAPLVDVAGWDEALGRLVEGVDDLAAGLHDLGASPATLPWVVAAGLMLVASEAARRARPRPRLAAAFVDGSASVVDPADDPSDRPRALPLSGSVRRLVARGLSRWTTRR